jgi:hypothetical protein
MGEAGVLQKNKSVCRQGQVPPPLGIARPAMFRCFETAYEIICLALMMYAISVPAKRRGSVARKRA